MNHAGANMPESFTRRDVLVEQLVKLGLAGNEALAWLVLVEADSGEGLTGYEVAARSGVPRSAVYAVLRKLEAVGAAFSYGQEPLRFAANDPGRWLDGIRRQTDQRVAEVSAGLAALPKHQRPEPIWIVSRYEDVISRIDRLIRSAERSLYLSLWPRELELLLPAIREVADRPIHRVLHSPAPTSLVLAGFSAWIDDTDDTRRASWSHKALVVIDRAEALIGGTEPGADNHAVVTRNPSLVDTATNHIVLDITLMARARGLDPAEVVAPMMRPHLGAAPEP